MTELALDWSPDAIFTEAHAREIMRRGACDDTLLYIGQTVDQCVRLKPYAALRYAPHLLTPGQLDTFVRSHPVAAMTYAAHLLTPEQLARC